ncbi:hypothetical protein L3X38_001991 [Prunus dulcis]|uniref:Uncharacterized protein n=1 Tax=Prunus dulcis TaxID=3755 RepID=A0AAD4ZKF4_PRUDU|nr:hypothetical protein L3X38_001991 [Prunus dulcis]
MKVCLPQAGVKAWNQFGFFSVLVRRPLLVQCLKSMKRLANIHYSRGLSQRVSRLRAFSEGYWRQKLPSMELLKHRIVIKLVVYKLWGCNVLSVHLPC